MRSYGGLVLALIVGGMVTAGSAMPARADWDHDDWHHHGYYAWGAPGYYYRPPVYYAPPPVVYAPPPVVYAPPPPPVYYAPAPVYVEEPVCRLVRERHWDGYVWVYRRVEVCD